MLNKSANAPLSTELEKNISTLDSLFKNVDTLKQRRFQNLFDDGLDFCIYYTDGVVDSNLINENIIKPLLLSDSITPDEKLFDNVLNSLVLANEVTETEKMKDIIESVTYGDTILFIQGFAKVIIISSKDFGLRGTSEPDGEKILLGPREGFTEGIVKNLSMIRRRIRSQKLKMVFRTMGQQSATSVCVCYIEDIVNPEILDELYRRLDAIDMDCILDSNYISEQITEPSALAFPTCGYTERPDVVSAKLLEGRIAIFVDGTPMVLTTPFLLWENIQSNEDYYRQNIFATFSRCLRFIGFFLSMVIPAVYVAIVGYHHQVLPISLLTNITFERINVPLPASVECFVIHICFDILREASVRMPSQVGQALSIVGALVIGQAAVEAKLVAAPMIIVVALTGINALTVPNLWMPGIICRYFLLLASSLFGLYGFIIGLAIILTHILSLNTMGIPYILFPKNLKYQSIKDTFFRARWGKMLQRYSPLSYNHTRSAPKNIKFRKVTKL